MVPALPAVLVLKAWPITVPLAGELLLVAIPVVDEVTR
jgi:hypothetical protein